MKRTSIIIPVFNADKYIDQCLYALQNIDYPKNNYEIIVVDNGSTDKTVEIIKQYSVQLFTLLNGTISSVRNFGASKANGEILAFIDGDCIAPKQWIKKSIELLENDDLGAVGCWYRLPENPSYIERIWDTLSSQRRERQGLIDWVPSSNIIIPAPIFKKINGFDESLTTAEDVDICYRIHQAGYKIYSCPDITVAHLDNPKTLIKFFLKEKWRGEGVIQNVVHEFPNIKWNKAIAFTVVTLFSLIGIFISSIEHNYTVLFISFVLLLFIPIYLTVKSCLTSRQRQYFIPLIFLFLVYTFARIFSAFNPRVWRK